MLRGCCHVVIPSWDFSWGNVNKCLLTLRGELMMDQRNNSIAVHFGKTVYWGDLWGEVWVRSYIQGHGCLTGRGVTEKPAPPWTWSVKTAVLWPCTAFNSFPGHSLYCPCSLRKKGPCELDTFHGFTDTCGILTLVSCSNPKSRLEYYSSKETIT